MLGNLQSNIQSRWEIIPCFDQQWRIEARQTSVNNLEPFSMEKTGPAAGNVIRDRLGHQDRLIKLVTGHQAEPHADDSDIPSSSRVTATYIPNPSSWSPPYESLPLSPLDFPGYLIIQSSPPVRKGWLNPVPAAEISYHTGTPGLQLISHPPDSPWIRPPIVLDTLPLGYVSSLAAAAHISVSRAIRPS